MSYFNNTRYAVNEPNLGGSFLTMLLGALARNKEWIVVFFFSGFMDTSRGILNSLWHKILSYFLITAVFDDDNECYQWMIVWLSQQPGWNYAREVEITTSQFGLSDSEIVESHILDGMRKISYLPIVSLPHTILYDGHLMRVTRFKESTTSWGLRPETLTINIYSWNRSVLDKLLLEAKEVYKAAQERTVCIYMSSSNNDWYIATTRPKRPIDSIVLDPGIKDFILKDAQDFLANKQWYASRGIPFRRGYLLYGAPGSGKTSLIHSLAGELGLHVFMISLSRSGLDDNSLSELIASLPEKSILLMEDIDAALHHGLYRDLSESDGNSKSPNGKPSPSNPSNTVGESSAGDLRTRITLSGLLNALDGVAAQEGRILFATTNKYSALDPALCRPGRMDLHIEFKNASKYQATKLFKRFYACTEDDSGSKDSDTKKSETVTRCRASKTSQDKPENVNLAGPYLINSVKPGEPNSNAFTKCSTSLSESTNAGFTGHTHTERTPVLSEEELNCLADSFAKAIPEREHSMASLQGYLMLYKSRPFEAVREVDAWVDKERGKTGKGKTSTSQSINPASTPSQNSDSQGTSFLGSASRLVLGNTPSLLPF